MPGSRTSILILPCSEPSCRPSLTALSECVHLAVAWMARMHTQRTSEGESSEADLTEDPMLHVGHNSLPTPAAPGYPHATKFPNANREAS